MNKNYLFGFAIFILLLAALVSATLNVSLSDQGTEVTNTSSGAVLTVGDLTVLIYDALTGGSLIYNETFSSAIGNGSWNVMLGEMTNLPLEFGKIYFKDYLIAGEDANFTNGTGQTVGRQFFYSPLGDINSSKIFGNLIGANATTAGATGIIPAPAAGQEGYCLKGDGTWGSCSTDFSCPTGFTMIENNGYQMGCIQNAEEGSNDSRVAVQDCYDTYGGRLPEFSEIYIGFTSYSLTDEDDDDEWIDGGYYDNAAAAIYRGNLLELDGSDWQAAGKTSTSIEAYRCFIPASGGGGGAELTGVFGTRSSGLVLGAASNFIITFDTVTGDASDWTTDNESFIVPAGKSGTYIIEFSMSTTGVSAGSELSLIPKVDAQSITGDADNIDSAAAGSRLASAGIVMELTEGQNVTFEGFSGSNPGATVSWARMGIKEVASTGGAIWSVNSTDDSLYYTAGNVILGQNMIMDNGKVITGKDSGGTGRTLVGTNGDDMWIGDTTRTGNMRFYTNGAERMTILSSGQITAPSLGDSNVGHYMCWNTGSGELMHSASACSGSSLKYKDNVIDYQYGLNELLQLRPVSFEYNYDKGVVRSGLLAEEVENIIPELVDYDEGGLPNSLFYQDMASLYIKSIQELKAENDALREELCTKDNSYSWC